MSQFDCLIVDDEADIRELLGMALDTMGLTTDTAADFKTAQQALKTHQYRLCLTDMKLPDGNGLDLIKHIHQYHSDLPVAMLTAFGNMECAIDALKSGAFDFVSKPVDLKVLRNLINTALKLNPVNSGPDTIVSAGRELMGSSPTITAILKLIDKLARNQAPVHISGESGTGKELAARMIHDRGPRREQDFVAVNCGAIPGELMESEFFGHAKGSFTGAVSDKKGLFLQADKGTLFLDEIADLPLNMQVKLLRAIQEKSIRPVGSNKETPVDVRIISATHKNLQQMVDEESFRQDLFFRINVIELDLPPLREHLEDLSELIDFFLKKIATANGASKPVISPDAWQQLMDYDYPGNVRELENLLEGAYALHENNTICANDLKLKRQQSKSTHSETDITLPDLDKIEKQAIKAALEKNFWNRTATAKQLNMTLRQLRYKIDKLKLVKK